MFNWEYLEEDQCSLAERQMRTCQYYQYWAIPRYGRFYSAYVKSAE
jgi:hypothetical protein